MQKICECFDYVFTSIKYVTESNKSAKVWFPYDHERVTSVVEIDFDSISTTLAKRSQHVQDHKKLGLTKIA